jgi:hypothetical protein
VAVAFGGKEAGGFNQRLPTNSQEWVGG